MPDPKLDLTVKSFAADKLVIKVQINSEAALDKPLQMSITLPRDMLSRDIRKEADEAPRKEPAISNVNTYVKDMEGKFSVWVEPESSDHFIVFLFYNDMDTAGADISPMILAAGAEFTIPIPLDPDAHHVSINLPYAYQYDGKPRVTGKIELKVEEIGWEPEVTFETTHTSPTAIEPRTEVKIKWKIKDGVSAVLRGPLPGGNTECSLSDSATSSTTLNFKLTEGWFEITAVASMTYMLIAEVKGPRGKPNVQVAKMLSLDITNNDKYGYVKARPSRVLPFGLIEFDWAAWGVKKAKIRTATASRQITLTNTSLSGFAHGSGVVRSTARKIEGESSIKAYLDVERDGAMREACSTSCQLATWLKMKTPEFTGKPLGFAAAGPSLGLLTTDGLWIAEVGEEDDFDKDPEDLEFTRAKTGTWIAMVGWGDKFLSLRQTGQNSLQVAIYDSAGGFAGIPPLDLKPLIGSDPVFDFAVYGDRAYVVVESLIQTRRVRSAFSVGFDYITYKAEYRNEFFLDCLTGYRLLTFDNALYALNRDSGQMLRLVVKDGKLEAYKAASAVDEQGKSMVKQGLLIPAGRVLAVLSPTSVPSLSSLANYGVKNVLPYRDLTQVQAPKTTPQDLVYSPQTDRWTRCGHGLDIKEGVAAFRGGDSARLWLIDPDHNTYTMTDATEALFLPDYINEIPSKRLPPFFNKKREFLFINHTGMQFVEMNETCIMAGLKAFSANGLVQLATPIATGEDPQMPEPVYFRYNEAEPPAQTIVRFLATREPGMKHEYVLEVTFDGPGFRDGTTSFKRVTVDERGNVSSVVDMPDKVNFPVSIGLIERFPRQLTNGIRLRINNLTPYTLWLRSPNEPEKKHDPAKAIEIKYNTPPFSIYAHGVGEFPVDVDFSLPDGSEMSAGSEAQKQRIRIRCDGTVPFVMESVPVKKTNEYDAYEFSLRYKVERKLNGAYMGDGVPGKGGESIFLPLAEAPNVSTAKILKIDANSLETIAQVPVDGKNIFTCPNSIASLSDIVVAIFDREYLKFYDHALKPDQQTPRIRINDLKYNIVTNLKASAGNTIFMLGMKETPTGKFKYSYSLDRWSLSPIRHEASYPLDYMEGFQPGRVPGAPTWVAPNTISPMDVRMYGAVFVCIEGGIFGWDEKNDFREIRVEIPGAGREEAILVDPTEHIVFCAHSIGPRGAGGLMISRMNISRPGEMLTIELPGSVTHIVTDQKPPTDPKLDYYRPRAVSLLATSDALFVSHATKIYVLDKTTLTQRQVVPLSFPARLIQVRRVKLPGDNHEKYGAPKECYMLWAIGSIYMGDGQTVKAQGPEVRLYKIAVL